MGGREIGAIVSRHPIIFRRIQDFTHHPFDVSAGLQFPGLHLLHQRTMPRGPSRPWCGHCLLDRGFALFRVDIDRLDFVNAECRFVMKRVLNRIGQFLGR